MQTAAQWQWLNPKPSGYINAKITFVNPQTGFILQSNGDLYKTPDTGNSWQLIDNFPKAICMELKYLTGVIAGYNGILYISSDNGNSWQAITTSFTDAIETVNIVSRDTIFLSSGYKNNYASGNIYQTNDRGMTWTTLHCNTPIHDIKFINSKIGFVGGAQAIILKTTDGGLSWQQKHQVTYGPSSIKCMQVLGTDTVFAFKETNSLLKSTDGGNTWDSAGLNETVSSMHFVNSTDGYLGGEDGSMFATHDGGKTFTWIGFDGLRYGNDIYSVYFLSRDTGFAVGLLGRIIKTINGGINWSAYSTFTYLPVTAASFGTSTTGYAANWNNLFKTIDKGQTWDTLGLTVGTEYPSQSRFSHAHFSSADTGFVISSYPLHIHHTVNGGLSWQTTNPLSYNADYASDLQFIDGKIAFMSLYPGLYYSSNILQTRDGGLTWAPVTSSVEQANLKHIFYVNKDTGYAINYYQILKTVDGSKSWNVIYSGDFSELATIVFISAKKGFAAYTDGRILVTVDSGQTWSFPSPGTMYSGGIQTLQFYNEQVGYFTSRSFGPSPYGSIYQTIDSGSTWQLKKDITGNSIVFTPDSSVVITGFGGALLTSKLRDATIDSLQVITSLYGCSNVVSANITAVFSFADSISFLVESPGGRVFTLPATPAYVNNKRITATAAIDTLLKDSLYKISVQYLYDGSYRHSSSISFTYPGALNKWTGQFSSAWENALNWSCGTVPGRNTDVVINSFLPRYPVINSNTFCKSLTIQPGANLMVTNGFKLTITGK
ncbi:MAG: YCF48-related protein [Ferruginibacter sp.]